MTQSRNEKGTFFLVIIFFILILLALVLYFALQTNPVDEVLENNQLLNVLFVIEEDDQPLLTNVLVYYPGSQRGALFDIPGNIGLILTSSGANQRVDRIDSVYKEEGIEAYKEQIETLADIDISFTIEMSLEQFSVITDLLGGLKVFIPSPIDVINDDVRYLLPSGAVELDGDKILSYMKYNSPVETEESVKERMEDVMVAFLYALNKNSSYVLNENVFSLFCKHLTANVDKDSLKKIVTLISSVDSERLVPQSVSGTNRVVNGQTLLFPDWDGQLIKEVFKQTMSSISSSGEVWHNRVYVLEIQNGTMTQGLAKNTSNLLKSYGYDVLNVTNAETQDYQKTVIIDHIGDAELAQALGDIINCTNIETEKIVNTSTDSDSLVDFTIILGRDFNGRYVR